MADTEQDLQAARATMADRIEAEDWAFVLESREGRRIVKKLLAVTGALVPCERSPFSQGLQTVGLMIYEAVREANPDAPRLVEIEASALDLAVLAQPGETE